jgi:Helix-turn-helix domain
MERVVSKDLFGFVSKSNLLCCVGDCSNVANHSRYCSKHYIALRKTGDPLKVEIKSKAGKGDAQRFLANVLRTFTDECIFWPYSTIGGIAYIRYEYDTVLVPRLICELMYGLPPSDAHQAAHLCGNGHLACINWRHISWKTHDNNTNDRIIHGTTKLNIEDIREIRRLADSGLSQREISLRFNVHEAHISRVVRKKIWRSI